MADRLEALHASVDHLAELARPLTADQLRSSAYPTEWTIADVLSHLGSGAALMGVRLDASIHGTELEDDFGQPVWDEWNAKSPEAQRTDARSVDAALLATLDSLPAEQRALIRLVYGRLDREHTPPVHGGVDLDDLRRAFPGV